MRSSGPKLLVSHPPAGGLFASTVAILIALLGAWGVHGLIVRPSNDRDWTLDQSRLATASIHDGQVTLHNLRHFSYLSEHQYEPGWYDATYDLDSLESVWFIVEPFGAWAGLAHTFVSFGFGDGEYVAFSIEIRKEKGESFSPVDGLFRNYELSYVIGDERDLIGLRAIHRNHDVFLYPVRTSKEKAQQLFLDMTERANQIAAEPEFYNTISNTCTTNLVDHANRITPGRIRWHVAVLFPGYSDTLARQIGLIDSGDDPSRLREIFRINEQAVRAASSPDFSRQIRENLPSPGFL